MRVKGKEEKIRLGEWEGRKDEGGREGGKNNVKEKRDNNGLIKYKS